MGPLTRWRVALDPSAASSPPPEEGGDSQRLLGRWLNRGAPGTSKLSEDDGTTLVLGSDGWSPLKTPSDPEADAEFEAALALLKKEQLVEAEEAFSKIAKNRKGTHWGEKAQFQLAECQYRRGKYVAAHESYEELIKKYTGTQYLDRAVEKQYAIACVWLKAVDPDAKPEDRPRRRDRFNGKFPFLDTTGYALAALDHVRQNNPTGALADDAVMRIADHHFKNENWEEAAVYYDELIAEHPKSPLLHQALLSSIDAKMRAYLGPDYDGAGLEQARDQILQVMTSFPEQQASHSDSLYKALDLINEQMAERAFRTGEHYLWTGKVASAEYYFGMIPVKWPKSPYAKQAKEKLAVLAMMPRKETKASRMMTMPGSSDPLTGSAGVGAGGIGPNTMSGPNGMGMGGLVGP